MLYLVEVLVDKIAFAKQPVPQKKQIIVHATCADFINLEIRTDVMGALETQERSGKRTDVDIGCGKSLVFSAVPAVLKEKLQKFPMDISVSTKLETVPIGKTHVVWNEDYLEMVESSKDALGYVSPVFTNSVYTLMNDKDPTGQIQVFIRLIYLGSSIGTQIQIMESKTPDGGTKQQYLFKSDNNATTFQCEKFGLGDSTEVLPIAQIFGTVGHAVDSLFQDFAIKTLKSYESLRPSQSNTASCFGPDFFKELMSKSTSKGGINDDTTSIKERVNDLYMNFMELYNDYSTFSINPQKMKMHYYKEDLTDDDLDEKVTKVDYKTLTVEEIEKKICKHPDCPAAKKFAEYGIGPLAKTKGLGGMFKKVEAPITYGMSHVNGRIDNYGPLGTYSRPKSPSQPFVPKKDPSIASTNSTDGSGGSEPMRLSGGGITPSQEHEPLRLTGGGPVMNDDGIPNPIHACQDLMEEFNKLLSDYKNALGPCGMATCPLAPNLTANACKILCEGPPKDCTAEECENNSPVRSLVDNMSTDSDHISGCAISDCAYKREIITPADKNFKKSQFRPGCQSPHCPFQKDKLGIESQENILNYKPCAGEKCPFKVPDALPPIHWDCPDPLPEGKCKNPCCPYVRKEDICNKYFPPPKSPCDNPTCPFATVPCTYPGCPFAEPDPCPPVCPYSSPVPEKLVCTPSVCPYARIDSSLDCKRDSCPYQQAKKECGPKKPPPSCFPPEPETCGNPSCPFEKPAKKECGPKQEPEICDNPSCPFAKPKNDCGPQKIMSCFPPEPEVCDNPGCPFAKKQNQSCEPPKPPQCCMPEPEPDVCENPNCPFAKKNVSDTCSNPSCPFAKKPECPPKKSKSENCGNPSCPYVKYKKPSLEDCPNPKCPFSPNAKPKPKSCGNGDATSRNVPQDCNNPSCPYVKIRMIKEAQKKNESNDTICENPACPFAKAQILKAALDCENPECPYAKMAKKLNNESSAMECDNPMCPYKLAIHNECDEECTSSTTEETEDNQADACSILSCDNDTCPYGKKQSHGRKSLTEKQERRRSEIGAGDRSTNNVHHKEDASSKPAATAAGAGAGGSGGTPPKDTTKAEEKKEKKRKKKRKRRKGGKYSYDKGTYYPGNKVGHKECIIPKFNVPHDMGWLWNIHTKCMTLRPRLGWKPGAIGRTIAARIDEHRKKYGMKLISKPKTAPKGKRKRKGPDGKEYYSDSDEDVPPKPTLLVKKKDGVVYVTMNPLKDPKTLEDNENPYMDCSPMQFKITKNKLPKNEEFKMCYCGDDENEEAVSVSSTSSSELDIEFTPPAGIIHPDRLKRKKPVCHTDTQYNPDDIPKDKKEKKDKKGKKGKKGKGKGKKKK